MTLETITDPKLIKYFNYSFRNYYKQPKEYYLNTKTASFEFVLEDRPARDTDIIFGQEDLPSIMNGIHREANTYHLVHDKDWPYKIFVGTKLAKYMFFTLCNTCDFEISDKNVPEDLKHGLHVLGFDSLTYVIGISFEKDTADDVMFHFFFDNKLIDFKELYDAVDDDSKYDWQKDQLLKLINKVI